MFSHDAISILKILLFHYRLRFFHFANAFPLRPNVYVFGDFIVCVCGRIFFSFLFSIPKTQLHRKRRKCIREKKEEKKNTKNCTQTQPKKISLSMSQITISFGSHKNNRCIHLIRYDDRRRIFSTPDVDGFILSFASTIIFSLVVSYFLINEKKLHFSFNSEWSCYCYWCCCSYWMMLTGIMPMETTIYRQSKKKKTKNSKRERERVLN